MFDEAYFRNVLRISAALCDVIAIITVVLRFSTKGASCPGLVPTPLSVFVAVALTWKAISWRKTHDGIVATKSRLDDRGLQSPFMDAVNYNTLIGIVLAGFVGFSAFPLALYLTQCW
jgi:hypothetical protein